MIDLMQSTEALLAELARIVARIVPPSTPIKAEALRELELIRLELLRREK